MKLAVIDAQGNVLISWPDTASAHKDLADELAQVLAPGRFQDGKRAKVAAAVRAHLIELQKQTVRL